MRLSTLSCTQSHDHQLYIQPPQSHQKLLKLAGLCVAAEVIGVESEEDGPSAEPQCCCSLCLTCSTVGACAAGCRSNNPQSRTPVGHPPASLSASHPAEQAWWCQTHQRNPKTWLSQSSQTLPRSERYLDKQDLMAWPVHFPDLLLNILLMNCTATLCKQWHRWMYDEL